MNEQEKSSGNYITTAWLVIALALAYGAALAGVQIKLGPIIASNKLNETYEQIPQIVKDADEVASQMTNQDEPLIVTGGDGKETRVFRAVDKEGKLVGWVIPAVGQGFADRIEVLLGLNADATRITGLFVLNQKETPGLGEYITGDDFRRLFVGKSTDTPLAVVTGAPENPHEIKALTGATISSESIADIVNQAVANLRGPILKVSKGEDEDVMEQETGGNSP